MAAAPARVRWSSAAAMEVARSAWSMAATGSPWISDSADGTARAQRAAGPTRPGQRRPSPAVARPLHPRPRCLEVLLEVVQAFLDTGELAARHQRPDETERQHGPLVHHLVRDDPASHAAMVASCRSRCNAGTASSARSAARSMSPAATACRTAGTGHPSRRTTGWRGGGGRRPPRAAPSRRWVPRTSANRWW